MAVVAWPPPTPPNNRANATAQVDAHPLDHNRIADALDTILAAVTRRAGGATSNSSNVNGITTADLDVPNGSVTITALAGHRYRVNGVIGVQGGAAGQVVYAKIRDGANALVGAAFATVATAYFSIPVTAEIAPGAAGSRTYKLSVATNAGTASLNPLIGVHSITVDDVGT